MRSSSRPEPRPRHGPVPGEGDLRLHRDAFVLDLHAHAPGFVPQPARTLWRAATVGGPPEVPLDVLPAAGIDAVVAAAVGDPVVTRWYRGRSPWEAVDAQLAAVERQAGAAGATLVRRAADLIIARDRGRPAVLLAVEGADALDGRLERLDLWSARGVRMVGLVHLGDNALGTTCLPWQRYAGPLPVRRPSVAGLSRFGSRVVTRMNRLGLLVDVAHADRATVRGVLDATTAPVVASHSGARAVQDFPRYLTDDQLRGIAGTGGVIGLWPFRHGRTGVRDVAELVRHARHVAETVGAEHLALGTDLNGVPGLMTGYRGPSDLIAVTAALRRCGFDDGEVTGILGGNALRVLRAVGADH